MRKSALTISLGLMLSVLTGCSVYPIQMVVVDSKGLEGRTDVRFIDPNEHPGFIKVTQRDTGSYFSWEIDEKIKQKRLFRIKYHWLYYPVCKYMVVEGSIGDNKRKYPIVLDTGTSLPLFVHDIHILQNKLPIYPFKSEQGLSAAMGFCYLNKLQIGEATLLDWPALYQEKHVEIQLFGLRFARDKAIILGLPALRKFKYIAFDSIKKEVELSLNDIFEPPKSESWGMYTFSIEADSGGNIFLFVEIFIAGGYMRLQFDTGSGQGLAIQQQVWEKIADQFPDLKLKDGREHYPFFGKLACKKGIIKELEVGGRIVKNAKISVFPNDSLLMSVMNRNGLLGMQYFRDTIVVLDFEHQIIYPYPLSRQKLGVFKVD